MTYLASPDNNEPIHYTDNENEVAWTESFEIGSTISASEPLGKTIDNTIGTHFLHHMAENAKKETTLI